MAIALTSRATVYDRYAISRKFTAQETAINVVQGNISLLASESEITELKNGNKTMYSKLATVEVDLKSITLAVSSSEYQDINGVLSAITQARASITLNSQEIALKVNKDNIVSSINQSAEAISINANKINFNGLVTANDNFKILADGSMEAKNGSFSGAVSVGGANNNNGIITVRNASGEVTGKIDNLGAELMGTFLNKYTSGGVTIETCLGNTGLYMKRNSYKFFEMGSEYMSFSSEILGEMLRVNYASYVGIRMLVVSNGCTLNGVTYTNGDVRISGNLYVNGVKIN